MSWFSRLANALFPRSLDRDLADELLDHLQRRAAELQEKGFSPEDAHRRAQIRFGNTTRFMEESRRRRLWAGLEGTIQDIRYASRGMRKGPAFAITAVLSLALAIGANTAIYSIVDAAILRPLPVPNPERLFQLTSPAITDPGAVPGPERQSFSYPDYLQFVAAAAPSARLALFSSAQRVESRTWAPDAPFEKVNRAFVSGEALDILGVRPAEGRLFGSAEDRVGGSNAVAILSYDYWQRRFAGDPAVVGQALVVDGKEVRVVGVATQGFFGVEPGRFVDVWLPGTLYERQALSDSGWHWFRILGRFAPGVSPQQVQARLQPIFHDSQVQRVRDSPTLPQAIRKQFLESTIRVRFAPTGVSDFRTSFSRPLRIVFGVAAGILLIACANVASLLLARATARGPEMAMRISLGAGRTRLLRQMLTENLMLSLLAGGLGWLLARAVGPFLIGLISRDADPVRFALAIDTRVLLFCAGVSAVSAILFGLIPAWRASGAQPLDALRPTAGQRASLRLGKLFVSVQIACALCLVVVGAAFLFSLDHLLHVDPGFDPQHVAVLGMIAETAGKTDDSLTWQESHRGQEPRLYNAMLQLQGRLKTQPGVESASIAWWPIFEGGGWSQQVVIPGRQPSDREELFYRVSPGYFSTLRTPLLSGRDFDSSDREGRGPGAAIVNEAFARKYFGSVDVLGKEFSHLYRNSPVRQTIIGVAGDAHYYDLRNRAEPMVYVPLEGNISFTLYVRSPLDLRQIVHIAEQESHAVAPGMRMREVTTLETLVGNTLQRERLLAYVGGAFAFFGLLLAAIGLFGLLNYSVGRRTKEIGIRTALGARRVEVVSLVIKDCAALMAGGIAAGLMSALAILAVIRSLLFGVRPADPRVAGTAIALFLVIGLLAAGLPAHRAAKVDPLPALREE